MALELLAKYTMPPRALDALDTLIARVGCILDPIFAISFQLPCPLQPQKIHGLRRALVRSKHTEVVQFKVLQT